jgi:hypothetical protein
MVTKTKNGVKFILSLHAEHERILRRQAKLRGIILQEQIRAIVIPEWLAHKGIGKR